MRPKAAGFLVLLAALITVAVGHAVVGTMTAGTPAAMVVPGPPRIGDCVLWAPDPSLEATSIPVPVAFGPCKGVVAGEVVSVKAGRQNWQDTTVGGLMGTSGSCWEAASRYVGLLPVGGMTELQPENSADGLASATEWLPNLQVRGQLVGADALQKATGRDWSACLVRPEDLHVYLGSVRGAVLAGVAPAEYGDCRATTDPTDQSAVPCSGLHASERLGWTIIATGSRSRAELQTSCRQLAARLLRRADPTFAGVLSVVATSANVTTCALDVRGSARLTSSLIGIGSRPLPLAT